MKISLMEYFILAIALFSLCPVHSIIHKLPEEDFNLTQILKYYGYPCERHEVTTEDGYILTLHRVPHGKHKQASSSKYPVFLQHGILDSADTFALNPPDQSLAFILADKGYDVWLGNSRGNKYSKKHKTISPSDKKFWDFSFDEMAKYDLPASIDYILESTNHKDLYYIGHSQGTTIGFAQFSQNIEFSHKIRAMFALAPVATVGHIKGAIKVLSHISPEVKFFAKLFGIGEFLPSNVYLRFLSESICGTFRVLEKACGNVCFLIAGFDKQELNVSRVPVYSAHLPAGTSVRNIMHFAQMVRNKKFQMYDHGSSMNQKYYNQAYPPSYNVSSIEVPVALYYGDNDWLADPIDVENTLVPNLPNKIAVERYKTYDHLDFVWGIDANKAIYQKIIKQMEMKL